MEQSSETTSKQRPRWVGDVNALADAIDMDNPSDVMYVEKASHKLDVAMLGKQAGRIKLLMRLHKDLNFKRNDFVRALKVIVKRHNES